MRTEMDYLILGNLLFNKNHQNNFKDDLNWQKEYTLD